jgi:hypothetical protein
MRIGDPCPCCGRALVERKWNTPRQAGRTRYVYCAHDEAAWEMGVDAADEREAPPREEASQVKRRRAA